MRDLADVFADLLHFVIIGSEALLEAQGFTPTEATRLAVYRIELSIGQGIWAGANPRLCEAALHKARSRA